MTAPTTGPRTAPASLLRRTAARVAELAATPLVPADFLDLLDPLRNPDQLRGRVVAVHPETRDAVTLVIRPGRGWQGHTPGQYLRLAVDVEGVRHWRSYSLTGPARPDGTVTVTVKAIDGGLVSTHLVRRARPGLVLQLEQAAGEFVLPTPRPEKALFVTAGSGITPVMGMLREAGPGGDGTLGDVVVVHSAPTRDDVVFGGELRALAARGALTLVERHTDTDGVLTVDELLDLVPDAHARETWACGPAGLLDALQERWDALGLELRTERFRPALLVIGDGGEATFSRSGITVEGGPATPLLEAGEGAGVLMPSGCRMGVCFGCVVPLRSGAVRDLRDGTVTTADPQSPAGVLVQTCVSAAAGPCEIDL